MRAWIYDETSSDDQRLPHKTTPEQIITKTELDQLGILSWHLNNPKQYIDSPNAGELGKIRQERNYKNYDIITVSKKTLPNYDEKIVAFFSEHLHEDEEIRLCVNGSGYFDIRSDINQKWIRIHVTEGDLIVLPAGCYHRFTVDEDDYIQAMRLFKDAPKWEAINRSDEKAEKTNVRKEYLQFIQQQIARSNQNGANGIIGVNGMNVTKNHEKSLNGKGFIRNSSKAASSLACYPHMRQFGNLVYLSGLSSRRPDNTHVGAERQADGTYKLNAYEQTQAVLNNIESCLAEIELDRNSLIDCTCFLIDMSHYDEFNRAYNEFFKIPQNAPTRTTVAVKQLPHPNLIVEIKAIAAAPN